ncbi:lysozyme [Halomonas cupida]|uniref:lysozyme n=1 Tax=Halomonas cupida TaxID=44933 RepID=UPI0039B457EE
MNISDRGIALIREFEGLELEAYPDPGTGGEPWTIGVGTTVIDGEPVRPGMTITEMQAIEYLAADCERFSDAVERLVMVPLNQNEHDALTSFAYNVGIRAFSESTLLKRLNADDRHGAANELLKWVHAGGKVMKGLERRRVAERELFLTPIDEEFHWLDEVVRTLRA